MAEFQKESLSLEEANRVRISLGLKPLVDVDVHDDDDERDHNNQNGDHDRVDNATSSIPPTSIGSAPPEKEAIRERVVRAQARRDVARRLRGPTLGESRDEDMSARDWIRHARRQAQVHSAERLQKQAEDEQAARMQTYTSSELEGLRVAHDLDEFVAGSDERVLTLRDANVLDENEDELMEHSAETYAKARADQRDRERHSVYTGVEELEKEKRGVLDKYDHVESLDLNQTPPNRHAASLGFRLGDAASLDAMDARSSARSEAQRVAEQRALHRTSLDYVKNAPVSDYEVSFKKKSKKKRAPRVKVEPDDDDAAGRGDQVASTIPSSSSAMEIDEPRKPLSKAEALIDDDELAASLARTRRMHAKASFRKVTPEMVARNLAATQRAVAEQDTQKESQLEKDDGVLTFDETTEFVQNIIARPSKPQIDTQRQLPSPPAPQINYGDSTSHVESEAGDRLEPELEVDSNAALSPASHPTAQDPHRENGAELAKMSDVDNALHGDVDTEAMASGSVASVVQFLKSQGTLEHVPKEQLEHEKTQLKYDAWLRERRRADRLAESDDQDAREDDQSERREAQAALERFKDYKPDVKIEYHDEYGRTLSTKEAWKQLSHTFHGNAPGHKAQEKRLRRIAEEQRRERMLAGDTSAMTRAFQERSERTGQAHMVLSVGQHDHAPQDIHLGAPPALEKVSVPVKKKTKTAGTSATLSGQSIEPGRSNETLEAAAELGRTSVLPTPEPAASPSTTAPASSPAQSAGFKPAMKPAFQPISTSHVPSTPIPASSSTTTNDASFTSAPASSSEAQPRDKVRISLGKRKAPQADS